MAHDDGRHARKLKLASPRFLLIQLCCLWAFVTVVAGYIGFMLLIPPGHTHLSAGKIKQRSGISMWRNGNGWKPSRYTSFLDFLSSDSLLSLLFKLVSGSRCISRTKIWLPSQRCWV